MHVAADVDGAVREVALTARGLEHRQVATLNRVRIQNRFRALRRDVHQAEHFVDRHGVVLIGRAEDAR